LLHLMYIRSRSRKKRSPAECVWSVPETVGL
jgi:hypothetical protein